MLPYKTIIHIDRKSRTPLYLQICNAFIRHVSSGTIARGTKLPGSRALSELLEVNRRTVISAYDELLAQGWVEIRPNQGSYISTRLPVVKTRGLTSEVQGGPSHVSGFDLPSKFDFLEFHDAPDLTQIDLTIDTGYPDVRLAPMKSLTQNLNGVLKGKRSRRLMNYASQFLGDIQLREALVKHLAETRGIRTTPDNIAIVRGSLMAFFSLFQVLLQPKDKVVVGDISFKVARDGIKIAGGIPVQVPVDPFGIDVDAIEKLCQQTKIRAVFVMPHHHHPTTVTLSADRRLKLLMLAQKYRFAIIEDDYDYDFHYTSSPVLPMASADHTGVVTYVGSFSKTVAPGLRTGFIVAARDLIQELTRLGRFIDCHGNPALERALAWMFRDGSLRRHLKKSLKTYHERRDHFCSGLRERLGNVTNFKIPDGGLAVWVTFNEDINLSSVRKNAQALGLLIPKTTFSDSTGQPVNGIRLGFASLDTKECNEALDRLQQAVDKAINEQNSNSE